MGAIRLKETSLSQRQTTVVLAICSQLFTHEDEFLDQQVERLTNLLSEHLKKPIQGFFFMGRRWIPGSNRSLVRATGLGASADIPVVPGEIIEPFLKFQQNLDSFTQDRQEIRQTLFTVVSRCESVYDLREALPESLAQLIPKIYTSIPILPARTKEPLWNLSPAMKAQFMAVMPKIDACLISKMVL